MMQSHSNAESMPQSPLGRAVGSYWIITACIALIVFIVGVPVLAVVAWNWMIESSNDAQFAKADAVKQKLDCLIASEVPQGSKRSQVQTWFDKHRVKHEYFADTTGDRQGNKTMPMFAGLRDEDLSGMERGWIDGPGPDDEVGCLEGGRITINFFFDKGGRMVGHYVECFVICL